MKVIFRRLMILALFCGLLTACQESLNHKEAPPPPETPINFKAPASTKFRGEVQSEAAPADESVASAGLDGRSVPQGHLDALKNRKLIYTASLQIEIEKYEESYQKVQSLIQQAGGFIADLQVYENPDRKKSATVTIRVPESAFQDTIDKLKGVGKLKSEQINGQDITEEYTDLEARLKNKRELETRLLDILRTKTGKLSDILEVETELARVREEIEQMEGRKRFLDDRVSLSTITVNLFEPSSLTSPNQWQPLRQALENMTEIFAGSLGALLMFVSGALPWFILGMLFVWILARWVKRRRAKRHPKPANEDANKKD